MPAKSRSKALQSKGSDENVEVLIASIATMTLNELRAEWHRRHASEPPVKSSADMLRRFLAWHIQVEAYGGLSAVSKRRIWSLEQALSRDPDHAVILSPHFKPGTVLVREWKGVHHRVEALESGFVYNGKHFTSLTKIARAITRTHWSGPAFFGLRRRDDAKGKS